jgi:phosphoglycerol transferase MdoB-like AlkP superfamily enzyme
MLIKAHRIYISILISIIVFITVLLMVKGIPYYSTSLEERFYHPDHDLFKPSGLFGHGLGIVGTLLIVFGVFSYMARKRYRFLSRFGRLKYWLEFHIFLCVLGPIMILFHTAFKFGGIVSISFWSMVVVVASGIIGRYIYLQIPRTIEGRELSLNEVKEMKSDVDTSIKKHYNLDDASYNSILKYINIKSLYKNKNLIIRIISKHAEDIQRIWGLKRTLRKNKLSKKRIKQVTKLVKHEISLSNKIERLQTMQRLFKYWHIAHLPFALIMLVIMVIHVGITFAFGARWIF